MNGLVDSLKNKRVLISGQAYTSRTETVEDYLKGKAGVLGVIALAGVFQKEDASRCRMYINGERTAEQKTPAVLIKEYGGISRFLLFPAFLLYCYCALCFFLKFRKRFDLFVGISHFSGLIGVVLKKLCLVKKTVYYCIDYYPPSGRFTVEDILVNIQLFIDRINARCSDYVWNISPKIQEARSGTGRQGRDDDKQAVVPLCFASSYLRQRPLDEGERWTIGFVGALSRHQGLELLFKALPVIRQRLPGVKMKVIGRGPFESCLRKMVSDLRLRDIVDFRGYLNKEEMKEELSSCALGVAPWIPRKDNYFLYSDPGKIKLYAFCGLPVIMTKGPSVADEIERMRVGFAVNYDADEFSGTVIKLLNDEKLLREYRKNAAIFANKYISENVFGGALEKTFNKILNN